MSTNSHLTPLLVQGKGLEVRGTLQLNVRPKVFTKLSNRGHKLLSLVDSRKFDVIPIEKRNLRSGAPRGADCLVLVDALNYKGLIGLFVSVWLGCPFVVRLRGDFVTEQREIAATERIPARLARLLKLCVSLWMLRRVSAIVFNSRYLCERLAPFAPKEATQHVVQNPITVPDRTSRTLEREGYSSERASYNASEKLRLLSLTNMEARGKVMGLVEAIEWLSTSSAHMLRDKVSWKIYGKGRYSTLIADAIENTGLQDCVRLHGHTNDVVGDFDDCDVFMHFSNLDAFPNVTLEAMYFSKPIITNTKSCGTLEQVEHGRNGAIVSHERDLASALTEYLRSPELRAAHGNAGHEILQERYTSEVLTRKMSTTLLDILQATSASTDRQER